VSGTFGENSLLSADMARAYVDGFQTSGASDEIENGWGFCSVNAMVKHWPVDAIVVGFDVQDQAVLDIITGASEPSGLLPIQMPLNMKTVEEQFEDVSHDMEVHVDSEGNSYDFAFGLNWNGVIKDERTEKYSKK
jgi:hypothetical protein